MINLFRKIYYAIQFEVTTWLCKPAMIIKAGGLWLIDFANRWYKRPQWNNYEIASASPHNDRSEGTLSDKSYKYERQFKFTKDGNFIYALNHDNTKNIGDECLFTGIYSAYNSIFVDGKYFETYIKHILTYNGSTGWVLLRGKDGNKVRWDASGDQLTGFLLACGEYKASGNKLPENVRSFLNQFVDERVLYDEKGVSKIGNYKPNFMSINGDCAIFLTACAVADRWDVFEEFYDKYGYKFMLPHTSIYLFDDRYWFGKYISTRNWFSCNVAIIALCTLFQEMRFYSPLPRGRVYNSILKILKNNRHNLFFWLLARHAGVVSKEEIPQEALSYFETFRIIETEEHEKPPKGYMGSLMPMGLYMSNWVWEREPYKILTENKWVSRLDMVFVQKMKERYLT